MRGILRAGLLPPTLALGLVMACSPAFADQQFGAEDAAYIDWSWKNCQTMSTAKEHALADAANGGAQFHTQYLQQFHKIADVERSFEQISRLCATIQDRYGSGGSVFSDLISARGEKPSGVTDSPAAPAAAPAASTKHHGRPH
jgi:hypothetical protein